MSFWEMFRFEGYYQCRRPAIWIYFAAVLGLISLVIGEVAEYARTVEGVLLHAPVTVAEITGYANKFGLLLVAALAGDAATRDGYFRMDSLLYTTPLRKGAYLGGRFLGTFVLATALLLAVVPVSLLIAAGTGAVEPALLGPLRPAAYLRAGLFLTVPNVFVATALAYAMVLLCRHALAAYATGLLLFMLGTFNGDVLPVHWPLGKFIDPTGLTVVDAFRRTLPPLRLNAAPVPLEGFLLANRMLWLGLAGLVGAVAYSRFRLAHHAPRDWWGKRPPTARTEAAGSPPLPPVHAGSPAGSFGNATRAYQAGALAWRYYREGVGWPAGLVIPAVAVYAFILIPNLALGPLDVPGLATTARVTSLMNHSALRIVVVGVITLLAGQLVWRERDTRMHEMVDAAPVPDRVLLAGKYLGLVLFLGTLQTALLAAGIAVQLTTGGPQPDPGPYLGALYGDQLPDYCLFGAVAMALHVAVNGKYVGHLVVLLFYFYTLLAARFGVEHKLLVFGSDPGLAPSGFYGQRPFLLPWLLFKLYWAGWALLLLGMAKQLWVRGGETGLRGRLQRAGRSLRRSRTLPVAFLLIVTPGAAIFYHTNVLNAYQTTAESRARQVEYERRYRKYAGVLQPHLTATTLHVEFYPDQRAAVVRGAYQLTNGTGRPVDSLHLAVAPDLQTGRIRLNRPARAVLTDFRRGHLVYAFGSPLRPGDSVELRYEVRVAPRGFSNRGVALSVLDNGSYFRNSEWLPAVGYQPGRELGNDQMRRTYGLPPRRELASLHDLSARTDRSGRELVRFAATVGTAAGQTAIAPGSLRKTWSKGGRRYFHYVADRPIRNLYHVYSADYAVRASRLDGIATRIFYHPPNGLNLDRLESGMRASLAYYGQHLGPYPYRQLSFVEYPDPGTGGISLPGTVGYSTHFALLNPGADARGFDLIFAVAAHEVAHQWWGHQLAPAPVEGAPLLSESLAWYSALGVVEATHGPVHLRNLLDAMRREYLNPRSRAGLPLLRATDGFQAYRKGPFAMYALREYVGAERVNGALRDLLQTFQGGGPPFATSLDLYARFRGVTPDSLHSLLEDLFATNTFWDLRTKAASTTPTGDGHWLVTMDVLARKVRVDSVGAETERPMHDLVEIGMFGDGEAGERDALYLAKRRIHTGLNRIVVKVGRPPREAGIDPRNLLIDTDPHDNRRPVRHP